jgi:hypothetical protein
MARLIRPWLTAVGLILACNVSLAVAQVKILPPSDQPVLRVGQAQQRTPPPTGPTPTSRSQMRFEPRPDLQDRAVPVLRGGRVDTLPVWPIWDGVIPVIPADVVQPSQTALRGGLQLDVQPWRAEVYVDGDYAGTVQDFGGYYRPLELIPGPHAITIVAPDFDPLMFDVVIVPGRTTTYRGTLSRASGR